MEEFNSQEVNQKKIVAGVLAILLGAFGAHKFYLGYTKEGATILVITILIYIVGLFLPLVALLNFVVGIFTLIEGIVYLTKSNEVFYNTYLVNKKPWM
jgi:TM2 domain-containing membrane protein YozV